jgi:hypothetical protein
MRKGAAVVLNLKAQRFRMRTECTSCVGGADRQGESKPKLKYDTNRTKVCLNHRHRRMGEVSFFYLFSRAEEMYHD